METDDGKAARVMMIMRSVMMMLKKVMMMAGVMVMVTKEAGSEINERDANNDKVEPAPAHSNIQIYRIILIVPANSNICLNFKYLSNIESGELY